MDVIIVCLLSLSDLLFDVCLLFYVAVGLLVDALLGLPCANEGLEPVIIDFSELVSPACKFCLLFSVLYLLYLLGLDCFTMFYLFLGFPVDFSFLDMMP